MSDFQRARYERKFPLPELGQAELEPFLRLHRLAFREVYAPRQVNNIYLDSPDLRCFHDNLVGASQRFKPRLRWYGESVPLRLAVDREAMLSTGASRTRIESDPKLPPMPGLVDASPPLTLEIKRKQGQLGIKESWAMGELGAEQILAAAWALCSGRSLRAFGAAMDDIPSRGARITDGSSEDGPTFVPPIDLLPERLRSDLRAMWPVLYNRYRRRYFLSADGRFRLTLDHRMAFRQILSAADGPPGRAFRAGGSVIELKYAAEDDERLRRMLVSFPFRMARSSKYVSGMRACWR